MLRAAQLSRMPQGGKIRRPNPGGGGFCWFYQREWSGLRAAASGEHSRSSGTPGHPCVHSQTLQACPGCLQVAL
eukprot:363740-Chlamydomonas_euryale.AAC.17